MPDKFIFIPKYLLLCLILLLIYSAKPIVSTGNAAINVLNFTAMDASDFKIGMKISEVCTILANKYNCERNKYWNNMNMLKSGGFIDEVIEKYVPACNNNKISNNSFYFLNGKLISFTLFYGPPSERGINREMLLDQLSEKYSGHFKINTIEVYKNDGKLKDKKEVILPVNIIKSKYPNLDMKKLYQDYEHDGILTRDRVMSIEYFGGSKTLTVHLPLEYGGESSTIFLYYKDINYDELVKTAQIQKENEKIRQSKDATSKINL